MRIMRGIIVFIVSFTLLVSGYVLYTGTTYGIPVLQTLFPYPSNVEVFEDGSYAQLENPPSPEEVEEMEVRDTDKVLRVPSVGIEETMQSMQTFTNSQGIRVINPFKSKYAYHVRDWGDLGQSEEMIVLAMHSLKGKPDIPGSKLINITEGTSTISEGAEVEVDGLDYSVSTVHKMNKNTVVNSEKIWNDEPGKLLIFTCLQREAGQSVENIIIEAQLTETGE